jgi:hypothetical protein
VQNLPVEKHQGVQGRPLGGGRPLALGGQGGDNALHLLGPEPVRVGLAAEVPAIAQDPGAIGLLGAVGVVIRAEQPRAPGPSVEGGDLGEISVYFYFDFP